MIDGFYRGPQHHRKTSTYYGFFKNTGSRRNEKNFSINLVLIDRAWLCFEIFSRLGSQESKGDQVSAIYPIIYLMPTIPHTQYFEHNRVSNPLTPFAEHQRPYAELAWSFVVFNWTRSEEYFTWLIFLEKISKLPSRQLLFFIIRFGISTLNYVKNDIHLLFFNYLIFNF